MGAKLLFDSLAGLPGLTVDAQFSAARVPAGIGPDRPAARLPGRSRSPSRPPELRQLAQRAATACCRPRHRIRLEDARRFEEVWKREAGARSRTRSTSTSSTSAEAATGRCSIASGRRSWPSNAISAKAASSCSPKASDFANQSTVMLGPPGSGLAGDRLRHADRFRRTAFRASGSRAAWSGWRAVSGSRDWRSGLAICAALFLWRNTSAFPPPAAARRARRFRAGRRMPGCSPCCAATSRRPNWRPPAGGVARLATAATSRRTASQRAEADRHGARRASPLDACAKSQKILKGVALTLDQFQSAIESVTPRSAK